MILAVELWGAAPYLSMVHRGNERAKETNQRYANEMAATLTQLYEGKRMYVLGENLPNAKIMPHVPIFYHLDKVLLSDDREDIKSRAVLRPDRPAGKIRGDIKRKDCSV